MNNNFKNYQIYFLIFINLLITILKNIIINMIVLFIQQQNNMYSLYNYLLIYIIKKQKVYKLIKINFKLDYLHYFKLHKIQRK